MTARRRKLFAIFVIATVMVATLWSVLRETHVDDQYGMARIHLAGRTVYVKSRLCGSACNGGLWLSRNSDRCKPPDLAVDYSVDSQQILFAREGNTLTLVEDAHAILRPTAGDWIDMKFVPRFGPAADTLPLHAIIFGQHLPARNVPADQVELGSCVRVFGHDWF